eukprot:GILJ01018266.1.p1 GENE.GILJ01018266.1~~GILJ01018266.1.p1  ORF type:complete len:101 (+),score=12.23 GILJ01018266.1:186-488(+)
MTDNGNIGNFNNQQNRQSRNNSNIPYSDRIQHIESNNGSRSQTTMNSGMIPQHVDYAQTGWRFSKIPPNVNFSAYINNPNFGDRGEFDPNLRMDNRVGRD